MVGFAGFRFLREGHVLLHSPSVYFRDQADFGEVAFALGTLALQKVPPALFTAQNLPRPGYFEPFRD